MSVNTSRNLGGAIGIAMLETAFTWREQYHLSVVSGAVSLASNARQQTIATLTQYFLGHGISDPATARHEAIGRIVKPQASLMGYGDTFFLLGAALLLAPAATPFLRKAGPVAPGGAH